MSLEPGQILDGKYRVGRLIGEGGMGTVYEGENSRIGRRVAIKVLHAQVASMPEFVERFEREARAAARIGSPHVCDVLDLGDLPSGDRYIVMEYLDGVSFEDRLADRGKLTTTQLAPIAFELLEGLGTMHGARVIHRDLKPANVFLARTPGGRGEVVKILDFGVAKLQPFEGEVGTMTQTGTMMGTPLYMSPEQARGARDVDGRTDIYAASVMFYRALAGVLPYTADTLNELLFKIVLEEPRPLREVAPEVDEVFAEIVHRGLARDVAQRFQSAREYQEAIATWGKAKGRSSLSIAITMPSDHPGPPASPRELPVTTGPRAVTHPNDGTPTAWSEDGPEEAARRASSEGQVAAVRPAAGAASDPPSSSQTVASSRSGRLKEAAPSATTGVSAVASTVAVKSEPPQGSWSEGPEASAVARAVTASAGPALDDAAAAGAAAIAAVAIASASSGPSGATTAKSGRAVEEARPRKLPIVLIGLGLAGALGLAAILAFGREAPPPPATGLTSAPNAEGSAAAALSPPLANRATGTSANPSSTGTSTSATTTAGTAADDPLDAGAIQPAMTGARPVVLRRPNDLRTPGSSAVTTAAPSSAVTATAATPPVASASAKPAGSTGRKFRTTID